MAAALTKAMTADFASDSFLMEICAGAKVQRTRVATIFVNSRWYTPATMPVPLESGWCH